MCNKTFHNRMYEISLNESFYGGEFWKILDRFAPKMWYRCSLYPCNEVDVEFARRLPEFRKWAKAQGITWFKTWEEREMWFDALDERG